MGCPLSFLRVLRAFRGPFGQATRCLTMPQAEARGIVRQTTNRRSIRGHGLRI